MYKDDPSINTQPATPCKSKNDKSKRKLNKRINKLNEKAQKR
jgi:hypothetical protein